MKKPITAWSSARSSCEKSEEVRCSLVVFILTTSRMSAARSRPIGREAQACIDVFDSICESLQKHLQFANRLSLLSLVTDQLHRLRLWARNTGALQQPSSRSSLDARLAEAPLVADQIVDFLQELRSDLGEGRNCEAAFRRNTNIH